MADAERKEKLAAAKKKLKKFQQKSGRSSTPSAASNQSKLKESTSQVNGSLNGQNGSNGSASPMANSIPPSPQHEKSEVFSTPQQTPVSDRLNVSTERLHQLTRQMNGLLSETNAYITDSPDQNDNNNSVQDLEKRNCELASLLQKHTQMNEKLNRQIHDMKESNGRLQNTLDHDRKTFEERLKRELGALKEQLQVHIQTIGILVAEKTELQSSITQSQKLAEQRLGEIEELSGRLKASRQRVGDLEKNFTSASSSSHKYEQSVKDLQKEVDRLKLDLYKINKSNEEFQQKNSELEKKLQNKLKECGTAEDQALELKGKLEMTQLHLQQIQNTGVAPDNSDQIQQLLTEKSELQARIDQYLEAYQSLTTERDQIAKQYQEYIDQLYTQTNNLQAQINTLIEEKEQYAQKQTELESVIEDLKTTKEVEEHKVEEESGEKGELLATVGRLQGEVERLTQQYQAQVNDNQQLSRLVEEREAAVMELEVSVQRLTDDQVDQTALLDNLQSDKTALSRAMAQNKELKSQLAELQNGFVKMSNENMELLTQFTTEQHTSKELGARLGQQEEELKEIRETLSRKEILLRTLQETTGSAGDGESDHDNQVRKATEQLPLIEALQKELASAQDTINALTNQNSELKTQVIQGHVTSAEGDTSQNEHLSASIRQLEQERNQVLEQLREEQHGKNEAEDKLHQLQHELASQAPATLNGDIINKAQFEALQHAMKQLEMKYTKAMKDKADFTDKIERLEHVVMQLEGESETIGEYVSLYQTQRSVLRQRYNEKEEYISRLSRDREDMYNKLGQLQSLVMQLLAERNMLHTYQHQNKNQQFLEASKVDNVIQPHLSSVAKTNLSKQFGAKLESSNLEDWPDYSSDSDNSDESQVEPIVGTGSDHSKQSSQATITDSISLGAVEANTDTTSNEIVVNNSSTGISTVPNGNVSELSFSPDLSPHHNISVEGKQSRGQSPHIPLEDHTAQRILHLLSEIGNSNMVERNTFTDRNFVHCSHCTGRLQTV